MQRQLESVTEGDWLRLTESSESVAIFPAMKPALAWRDVWQSLNSMIWEAAKITNYNWLLWLIFDLRLDQRPEDWAVNGRSKTAWRRKANKPGGPSDESHQSAWLQLCQFDKINDFCRTKFYFRGRANSWQLWSGVGNDANCYYWSMKKLESSCDTCSCLELDLISNTVTDWLSQAFPNCMVFN